MTNFQEIFDKKRDAQFLDFFSNDEKPKTPVDKLEEFLKKNYSLLLTYEDLTPTQAKERNALADKVRENSFWGMVKEYYDVENSDTRIIADKYVDIIEEWQSIDDKVKGISQSVYNSPEQSDHRRKILSKMTVLCAKELSNAIMLDSEADENSIKREYNSFEKTLERIESEAFLTSH